MSIYGAKGYKGVPILMLLTFLKLEASADIDYDVALLELFFFARAENIVGKGQNAGYQHFLLFPQCCQKASFSRLVSLDCEAKGYLCCSLCHQFAFHK